MPARKKKPKPRRRVPAKPPPIDPARVNQVVKWVLSGATPFDIVESIKATYAGEDPGRLILEAMRHFEAAGKFDPDVVIGWCFEATKDLYRQMVATGDFPGALRAVKQMLEMTRYVYDEGPEGPEPEAEPAQIITDGTAEQAPTQTADGTRSSEPVAGGPEPAAGSGAIETAKPG